MRYRPQPDYSDAMLARVVHFLRPTFYAVVAFAAIVGIARLFMRNEGDPSRPAASSVDAAAPLAAANLQQVILPRPGLSPTEVVELQLAGLRDEAADGVGIVQCYVFASPGNRLVTGPLERFGRLVRQPPFASLGRSQSPLIGRPHIDGDVARLLVTVADGAGEVQGFTFILSRQPAPPVQGCWMTDAVLPAGPPPEPPPPADSLTDAA